MGQSITVTEADFEAAVLTKSFDHPVLVDFYATWCGPCQLLKPTLEALAEEYDITLAKVDIDSNPQLARTFRVEGVPDVRVVTQGQVQEGFVGVLPEPQIRQLLARIGARSPLTDALESLHSAQASGDQEGLARALAHLQEHYPDHPEVLLGAAQQALGDGDASGAQRYLERVTTGDRHLDQRRQALQELLALQAILVEFLPDSAPLSPLELEFRQGCQATLAQDYPTALEMFLALAQKDRKFRQDGARKAMLTIFKLLGDEADLTLTYRKRLMQSLY
jgi:putative thioredoxin